MDKLQRAGRDFLMRLVAKHGLAGAARALPALADEIDGLMGEDGQRGFLFQWGANCLDSHRVITQRRPCLAVPAPPCDKAAGFGKPVYLRVTDVGTRVKRPFDKHRRAP